MSEEMVNAHETYIAAYNKAIADVQAFLNRKKLSNEERHQHLQAEVIELLITNIREEFQRC